MKRRDPWLWANAPPKVVAVPEQVVKTRTGLQACLDLVRRPVAQPSAQASLKASLKIQGRKALDGPATRPKTPLAVENGVGKPAAPKGRPMPVRERELGALPAPICPCPTERLDRDLLFCERTFRPPTCKMKPAAKLIELARHFLPLKSACPLA